MGSFFCHSSAGSEAETFRQSRPIEDQPENFHAVALQQLITGSGFAHKLAIWNFRFQFNGEALGRQSEHIFIQHPRRAFSVLQ